MILAQQGFQPKASLRSNLLVVRVMTKDTKWVLYSNYKHSAYFIRSLINSIKYNIKSINLNYLGKWINFMNNYIKESIWTQICQIYQIPLISKLLPLAGDANETYRILISENHQQVLRIYKANSQKYQLIEAELKILTYLSQFSSIQVPKPLNNKQGQLLTLITNQDYGQIPVAMFSFIQGQTVTNIISPDLIFKVGQNLGCLDLALQKADLKIMPSPSRIRDKWDGADLINWSLEKFTKSYANHQFLQDDSQRQLKSNIINIAHRLCNNYRKIKSLLPHQLIHTDGHFDNFLWDGDDLSILDFDNLGYGPRIYEITAPLNHLYELYLDGKLNSIEQDLDLLNQTLISGYLSSIKLSNLELKSLSLMQSIHLFGVLAWMVKSQELTEYQLWLKKYGELSMERVLNLLTQHEKQLSFSKLLKIIKLEPTNIFNKISIYIKVIFEECKSYLHI